MQLILLHVLISRNPAKGLWGFVIQSEPVADLEASFMIS